ncbi:MAG: AAA family ATPase, partial [Elusimicrobiota bacterium]|nr:AAA family ATPase [Elusimicrobiota bacterium]
MAPIILDLENLQKLPVGIQEFSTLREEKYLYVDKTRQILDLTMRGSAYFLARPRRFGKSLLVSTLDALFSGRKELFEGLYIYDKWDWNKTYNVIRIDFSRVTTLTPEKLELSLALRLDEIAEDNEITLTAPDPVDKFSQLIRKMYKANGKKVVVLIDEYDMAILDNLKAMKETDISIENKKILGQFYRVLKGASQYLHFIFLTGVTRFAGLSVFSGLNNLRDLTLADKFAGICGYTQEELESNFKSYIQVIADKKGHTYEDELREIKLWY